MTVSDSANSEWMSLSEAARLLGLPESATRRLVHDGSLHAELRRGANGPQYYVPRAQFLDMRDSFETRYQPVVSDGMQQEIGRLRAALDVIVKDQEARESVMREEIALLRANLALGIEALRNSAVPPAELPETTSVPWWRVPGWRKILGI